MKIVSLLPLCATFALIACSGSSDGGGSKAIYHPDVGPFDENGDYVEALADAPVKKNYFARNNKNKKRKAEPKREYVKAPEPVRVRRVAQVTPPPAPRPVARVAPTPPPAPPKTVVIAQSPRPQAVPVTQAQPLAAVTTAPSRLHQRRHQRPHLLLFRRLRQSSRRHQLQLLCRWRLQRPHLRLNPKRWWRSLLRKLLCVTR